MNEEYGRTGAKRWQGRYREEFERDLQGIRGVHTYQEMSENDDVVGAILFAIKMLIRQADWTVRAGGAEQRDSEAAEFVESCLHDMQSTWTDTVSEILSFLTYGWSVHEIVYKRRMGRKRDVRIDSKFSDGLIGWQKLPIRAQESLYEWEYDAYDNLTAFVQMPAPDKGNLRRNWQQRKYITGKVRITLEMKSRMFYAGFLEHGTRKMAARPYRDRIKKKALPELQALYANL